MLVIIGLPLFLGFLLYLWLSRGAEPFEDPDEEIIQVEITFRTEDDA